MYAMEGLIVVREWTFCKIAPTSPQGSGDSCVQIPFHTRRVMSDWLCSLALSNNLLNNVSIGTVSPPCAWCTSANTTGSRATNYVQHAHHPDLSYTTYGIVYPPGPVDSLIAMISLTWLFAPVISFRCVVVHSILPITLVSRTRPTPLATMTISLRFGVRVLALAMNRFLVAGQTFLGAKDFLAVTALGSVRIVVLLFSEITSLGRSSVRSRTLRDNLLAVAVFGWRISIRRKVRLAFESAGLAKIVT